MARPRPTAGGQITTRWHRTNGLSFALGGQTGQYFHPFASGTGVEGGVGIPPKSITELRMIRLSAALRSKPQWWTKYKNETIREKWKSEALAQSILGGTLSEREVKYVLDELEGYEAMLDIHTGIQVSCTDATWQSDSLISTDLRNALIKDIAMLEYIPDDQKDWHPDSDEQVLDIVHPSLYCLVYNRTRGYPSRDVEKNAEPSQWAPIPQDPAARGQIFRSGQFAWIPTDFSVSEDGKSVAALDYINNLHPSHASLYRNLESVLALYIPLFERVLGDIHQDSSTLSHTRTFYNDEDTGSEGSPSTRGDVPDLEQYVAGQEPSNEQLPTVPVDGYQGGIENREVSVSLKGRKIQVIVKLATIHLTLENPEYKGGNWHVEGMLNEHIAASGIYYYSQDNIAESSLAFRTAVTHPQGYNLSFYDISKRTWGFTLDEPANQELGSISTNEGRCLAFPNIFQHRVSPFRLVDPKQPGYRKILVFFLVDPSISPILSTSRIPPQQKEWITPALHDALGSKLPIEIINAISAEVDGLMTRAEAEEYRLLLMKERSKVVQIHDERFFSVDYNMCEH